MKTGIDHSVVSVRSISEKTAKLDEARVKVVDVVQNLTAIAEENAASTQETSASMCSLTENIDRCQDETNILSSLSEQLNEQASKFKF